MKRQTVILLALLAVVLAGAALRFWPSRNDRVELVAKTLAQAGRLPLPAWLERKRLEWLASTNPL